MLNVSGLNDRDYIVEECVENHEDIKKLSPTSLNTIRIVTVIDSRKELHIIAALLRMGDGKGFTDNYHDGGMACPINVSTGTLTKTAYGMDCIEYEKHPATGIIFEGYKIPSFGDCISLVKKLSFEEPEARYVGWDLAITPTGIELLEANIPPGEDIMQIAAGKGLWDELNKMI